MPKSHAFLSLFIKFFISLKFVGYPKNLLALLQKEKPAFNFDTN